MIVVGDILPLLGWVILAALAAHEAWFTVRHAFKCNHHDKCTCWPSHRFLAGRTFHGHVVTDATFWRRSDKVKTKTGHCSPFQKLPGVQRRILRTGPALAIAGGLISPVLTGVMVAGVTAACLLLMTKRGRRAARQASAAAWRWVCRMVWSHLGGVVSRIVPEPVAQWSGRLIGDREIPKRFTEHHGARMQDMAQALATITGTSASAVKRGIEWNPGYAATEQGGQVATWYLPRGFKGNSKEQAAVNDLWQGRVGFELVPQWKTAQARPQVAFIRSRSLPGIAYLEDYAADLARLPSNQIGLGLDDRGELVCQDWDIENPHSLVVAGSRHGKTELNRSKTAQVTRRGGHVAAADCKRISFQGLEGVPGFDLRNNPRDIRAMWELARGSYDEMDRRAKKREENPTAEFEPWVMCIEELGQFSEQTDDWWDELDYEDPADEGTLFFRRRGRRTPRVWRYIKSLCFEGAEFNMHVDIDGQDGDHKYLKGLKPVLGLRILGGFQDNQWINCVGTRPAPKAPEVKGRFCLVNGAKQTWFQAFVGSLDKIESAATWRDYARDGRRLDGTQAVGDVAVPSGARDTAELADLGKDASSQEWSIGQDQNAQPLVPTSAPLREAFGAGIFKGREYESVRRELRRASNAPQPVRRGSVGGRPHEYDVQDLIRFAEELDQR